jgi:conjugative relaxase-like TrwC/TraI family protein
VLGIHRIGAAQADYYLADLATELPVPGTGRWAGGAAVGLGLEGQLDSERFRLVLASRHPWNGRPMGSGRTQVAGVDLTFSAPKSVSVLFALGGTDVAACVAVAHNDAVSGALSYVEQHALAAVRSEHGERRVIPTSGMVAGVFTHAVNRNHDPHVHSHVVMANLVHGADGRWGACDRRGLEAHRAAAGAIYTSHLRAGLSSALGVSWTRPMAGSAEVVGIDPALHGEFSSRSADIRRHVSAMGSSTARGRRVAWAVTRPPKSAAPSFADLSADWARRARAIGAAPLGAARTVTRPAPTTERSLMRLDEHGFAAVLSETPHGGAYRRDAVRAFAVAARDGASASAVERGTDLWLPPGGVGVAETMHGRRDVSPGRHLLKELGPRPIDPDAHGVWHGAATAIERYRERWGLGRSPEALGGEPKASLSVEQLVDHLRTARHVDEARARLGVRQVRRMELGR